MRVCKTIKIYDMKGRMNSCKKSEEPLGCGTPKMKLCLGYCERGVMMISISPQIAFKQKKL